MDNEVFVVVAGVVIFILAIFGALAFGFHLKYDCIKALADKPAIEIQLACK